MSEATASTPASDIGSVVPFPGAGTPGRNDAAKGQTERVMKMFTPAEQIEVIKADTVTVSLGHGAESRQFVIRPLSPKQLLGAYQLIQEILLPLAEIFKPGESIGLGDLVRALGPNIEKVPELIKVILDRGNTPVSVDWINENLDILLDLQLILPAFLKQNGLDKLFSPKDQ
jgi:hypothetical protein